MSIKILDIFVIHMKYKIVKFGLKFNMYRNIITMTRNYRYNPFLSKNIIITMTRNYRYNPFLSKNIGFWVKKEEEKSEASPIITEALKGLKTYFYQTFLSLQMC